MQGKGLVIRVGGLPGRDAGRSERRCGPVDVVEPRAGVEPGGDVRQDLANLGLGLAVGLDGLLDRRLARRRGARGGGASQGEQKRRQDHRLGQASSHRECEFPSGPPSHIPKLGAIVLYVKYRARWAHGSRPGT